MYKRINLFVLLGFIFTMVVGSLLHFVYEWTGDNSIVGIFSPVNESVWEHLKLLFFPMSVWLFIGYFKYGKKNPNYIFSSIVGLLVGLVSIVAIFYLYSSILGKNLLPLDILTFALAIIAGFAAFRYIFNGYNFRCISLRTGIIIWDLIFALFVIFTICPPNIFLFKSY